MTWNKKAYRELLVMWPMIVPSAISFFTPNRVETAPIATFALPFLSLIVWLPLVVIEVRRYKAEAAREKRELQAKYDAQDKAMFGKPLREIEL